MVSWYASMVGCKWPLIAKYVTDTAHAAHKQTVINIGIVNEKLCRINMRKANACWPEHFKTEQRFLFDNIVTFPFQIFDFLIPHMEAITIPFLDIMQVKHSQQIINPFNLIIVARILLTLIHLATIFTDLSRTIQ